MKHKIAIVYWTDAAIHGADAMTRENWIKHSGLMDGIAIGHILEETKEYITLAMDYFNETDDQDEHFRIVSTYPKSGIRKIIRQNIKV